MSNKTGSGQLVLIVVFLALTYVAHVLGGVVQIGGAQLAPSIVVYTALALLVAPSVGWGLLAVAAVVIGFLTMYATSSPYPPANIPSHVGGVLLASYLAKQWSARGKAVSAGSIVLALAITILVSWTLFSAGTWFGLSDTGFTAREWARFGLSFGTGYLGWWLYGFLGVAIPTFLVGLVLTPAIDWGLKRYASGGRSSSSSLPR